MRCAILASFVVLFGLSVGCGVKETPDATQVKQVDPAEIQKQIQEGMKKAGGKRQQQYQPPAK